MEEEYKEMWEYEMERRREKLEKWRKRGWLPISEEKMIKYELNLMTFEDWYDEYLVEQEEYEEMQELIEKYNKKMKHFQIVQIIKK